ncbi:hypothetical protein [Ascidiimonas aurantiaca]|uniref:hypothetical protein n=1 Tax=Ascidiimonas aurantiaca TaxID=1685432 RepID=UPI0030EBCBE8
MMKLTSITGILLFILFWSPAVFAQSAEEPSPQDKTSYYENRAREDAAFEQRFSAKSEEEEDKFWKEQKAYEKNLKKRDRKAYRAYMRGKRAAYREHIEHCDAHCHHSAFYYEHASFYYHGYHGYGRRYPATHGVRARVRLGTPAIRIGL